MYNRANTTLPVKSVEGGMLRRRRRRRRRCRRRRRLAEVKVTRYLTWIGQPVLVTAELHGQGKPSKSALMPADRRGGLRSLTRAHSNSFFPQPHLLPHHGTKYSPGCIIISGSCEPPISTIHRHIIFNSCILMGTSILSTCRKYLNGMT